MSLCSGEYYSPKGLWHHCHGRHSTRVHGHLSHCPGGGGWTSAMPRNFAISPQFPALFRDLWQFSFISRIFSDLPILGRVLMRTSWMGSPASRRPVPASALPDSLVQRSIVDYPFCLGSRHLTQVLMAGHVCNIGTPSLFVRLRPSVSSPSQRVSGLQLPQGGARGGSAGGVGKIAVWGGGGGRIQRRKIAGKLRESCRTIAMP